jgi:hypothetical protein
MRNLAEMKVVDLIGACRKYSRYSSRVRLFSRLCGLISVKDLVDNSDEFLFLSFFFF